MKVKDGFKFGIGYCIARGMLEVISDLTNKNSKIRKNVDRLVQTIKTPSQRKP